MGAITKWLIGRMAAAAEGGDFILFGFLAFVVYNSDVAIDQQRSVGHYFYNALRLRLLRFEYIVVVIIAERSGRAVVNTRDDLGGAGAFGIDPWTACRVKNLGQAFLPFPA